MLLFPKKYTLGEHHQEDQTCVKYILQKASSHSENNRWQHIEPSFDSEFGGKSHAWIHHTEKEP